MRKDASDLLNKLRQSSDKSLIDEAKQWLDKNPNEKAASDILREIEYRIGSVEDIQWCAKWLENSCPERKIIDALGSKSLVRVLLEENRLRATLGPDSGKGIDRLLDLAVSQSIVELTMQWLRQFPDSEYADFVLLKLLRAKPAPAHIGLARGWYSRNSKDYTADLILSKLIESGEFDLIESGLNSLDSSNEVAYSSELACTLVKSASDQGVRRRAIQWCQTALQGKESKIAASIIDTALPNEDLAPLVLEWCINHPKQKYIGNTWNALLFNSPSTEVFSSCWDWLSKSSKNEQWGDVFWFLLHAGAECNTPVPAPALKKAWELWEKGETRWIGVLIEADHTDEACKELFAWVLSHPDEHETVKTILPALLRVMPTNQVIEYATQWIKSRETHGPDSLGVLRTLLEKSPQEDLASIARQILNTTIEPQLHWSILELLIRTTKDDRAIARAQDLLKIEATLAFRRGLAYFAGGLFLALFECGERSVSLNDAAKEWIDWHAHKYSDLATNLHAHVSNGR